MWTLEIGLMIRRKLRVKQTGGSPGWHFVKLLSCVVWIVSVVVLSGCADVCADYRYDESMYQACVDYYEDERRSRTWP